MAKISYSDALLLKNVCTNICDCIENKKATNEVSDRLNRYVEKLVKKANGYWRLPEGKIEVFQALKTIAVLLKNNATKAEIDAVYKKVTSKKMMLVLNAV